MPEGITDTGKRSQTSISTRIREAVLRSKPLKPSFDLAIKRIGQQIQRLNHTNDKFAKRDKSIFAHVVKAYSEHNMPRANVLSQELAEVRRVKKMLIHSQLALEQIVIRLKTITELGDVVTTMAPSVKVLNGIRSEMIDIFPQADVELGQIGNLLSGMIIDTGNSTAIDINFEEVKEEAKKIMAEAASVAEQNIKEIFPASIGQK